MSLGGTTLNSGSGGDTLARYTDGTRIFPAGVTAYVSATGSPDTITPVDATHGLPVVSQTGAAWPVTDNAGSLTVDAPVGTPVFVRLSDGTSAITTLPVSAASLPLPSGAATAAKQPALGTAGAASADVLTVQGVASMTALKVDGSAVTQPVSGTVAATQSGNWSARLQDGTGNAITSATRGSERPLSVQIVDGSGTQITSFGGSGGTASNFGSADPASGTAAGFSDGTNMREARVYDTDSGAGTQYTLGVSLRKAASGGSVEAGTPTDPLRVDPTGTTTQPVSGTVTANQGGTWTVLPGNTANTTAWLVTGTGGTFPVTSTPLTNLGNATVSFGSLSDPTRTLVVSTWDPGDTAYAVPNSLNHQLVVSGPASHGFPLTAAMAEAGPLILGTVASAAAPTAVSADGDAVRLWADRNGRLQVGVASALPAGSNTIGAVTQASGPWSQNVTQWAGTAVDVNSGNKSAGTLRVVLATDQPSLSNALPASQSGTWTVQPGNTANTTPWLVTDTPATSGGLSFAHVTSAASNNKTQVKGSAGQLYSIIAVNLSASVRYLKVFNNTSAGVTMGTTAADWQVPIPSNSTNGGGVAVNIDKGLAHGTGITIAITGGVSLTDNTSISANDVCLTVGFK